MAALWSAIAHATRRDDALRVPFAIGGRPVGSVARAHLGALAGHAGALRIDAAGVDLVVPPARRDDELARLHAALRDAGLIRAWRNETYPIVDPVTLEPLALIERAASRFWGTLTFGAHATGYVAGSDGRPRALWIAQRAFDKATDPGAYDNLVGGGVPHGQTPLQTLVREGWEEAGLADEVLQRARPGRVIRLRREIPEGLQHEWIHVFDLPLLADETPANQDGEVAGFTLLPTHEALALAAGTTMTVDAALVTLDFALRQGLFEPAEGTRLAAAAAALWVTPPV